MVSSAPMANSVVELQLSAATIGVTSRHDVDELITGNRNRHRDTGCSVWWHGVITGGACGVRSCWVRGVRVIPEGAGPAKGTADPVLGSCPSAVSAPS